MNARTLEGPVPILKERSPDSEVVTKIARDTEVTLGRTSRKGGQKWTQVTLFGGATGYIPAETRLLLIEEHRLNEPRADVYDRPTGSGRVLKRLIQGDTFLVTGKAEGGGETWYRIRDKKGTEGYLPTSTKIVTLGGGFFRKLFGR